VPFYVPLIATLITLPIMWYKFKLPPSNPENEGATPGSA